MTEGELMKLYFFKIRYFSVVFILACAVRLDASVDPGLYDWPDEADSRSGWKPNDMDFVVMPVPISNPTIGTGLGVGVMTIYQLDETSPASSTTVGGMYVDSGSWALGGVTNAYFSDDRYRLTGGGGYGDVNIDFFGIGDDAGDRGIAVPVNQKGVAGMGWFLIRLRDNLYVGTGLRVISLKSTVTINPEDVQINLPTFDFDLTSMAIGFKLQYDSRDNPLNPKTGTYCNLEVYLNSESLGSDRNYQIYDFEFNSYWPIADDLILAGRFRTQYTNGDVPFYDLALFGAGNDLRGYVGGQYRDNILIAAQAELRWRFYKKWGMVAFAGIGEVKTHFSEFNTHDLLPSIGVGLRYLVSEENDVNISIDFAHGKDDSALYFYIGEAF
jgi:outer membrane protein assembly factor BamA